MNKSVALGILRHILTTVGGALTAKGYASSDDVATLVGALIAIAGVVWFIIEKHQKAGSAQGGVPLAALLLVSLLALISIGCASYLAVSAHDSRVDAARALQAQPGADGKSVYVGLDLLKAKGYMAAWSESPGTMTAATVIDVLTGVGAYYGVKAATGGDDKSRSTTVNVNGDNNNTVVGGQDASGSHNTTTTTTTGE